MPISYPPYWKEPFHDKGPKYDKIVEIIDAVNKLEGVIFATGTGAQSNAGVLSDGISSYRNSPSNGFMALNLVLPAAIQLFGTTLYPQITEATLYWWQGNATSQLDRFLLRRVRSDNKVGSIMVDDTTNRGIAGFNSFTWSSLTGRLDANYNLFNIIVYYIYNTSVSDFRFTSVKLTYNYA